MTLPKNPNTKPRQPRKNMDTGYVESNRKTQAFYITLAVIVGVFVIGNWISPDAIKVIQEITQLATVYIGGLAFADSVRYHKFGSNTLGNPEKVDKENELKERYSNK